MRFNLLVLLFCFNFTSIFAQLYITPTVGVDALKMKNSGFYETGIGIEEGFIFSPTFGLNMKYKLSKRYSISYSFGYTHKEVGVSSNFFLGHKNFTYDYFSNRLNLNLDIYNKFYAGLGVNCNVFGNAYTEFLNNYRVYFPNSFIDIGGNLVIGVDIKNINIEAYYQRGFIDQGFQMEIKAINSFGVLVGYKFKIFDKLTKNKLKSFNP